MLQIYSIWYIQTILTDMCVFRPVLLNIRFYIVINYFLHIKYCFIAGFKTLKY